MANPVKRPVDIVAQLDAIAAKDPVSQLSVKRRSAVQPDISWLTKSSPLAPQGRTSNLLAQLDANPYIKKDLPPLPKPGPGVSALKNLLMPLQILDTPRRAIISGLREVVDVLDTDPNTKASFGDFADQTKDFSYGFGRAFPMKGWAGRVVGLIGDVALDPLTWATLGGTVAAKATMLNNAGELVKTRSLIGKSVIGREGREKLASFTQQRMELMVKSGRASFSKEEIASAYKNIASQGKSSLPHVMFREFGIKGPGVYYFGSRLKVPGTDIVGKFLERGITRTRLGLVNTSGIKSLHKAITPRGVGAIEYFGEGTIKQYRIALANGSLTDGQAQLGRVILNADDIRRIGYSEADFDAVQRFGSLREEIMKPENNSVRYLLDNVLTEDMPAKAAELNILPQLDLAQRFRAVMEDLHDITDTSWNTVVPDHVLGYQKGYLPHNSTEQFVELMDEVASTPAMDGLLPNDGSAYHIVGNFRQRGLKEGSPFFGTILKNEDLTIDNLNKIVNDWLVANGRKPFDAFDTDMKNIVPAYIRGHSNMMSNVAMMNEFKKTPEFVKLVDGYFGITPEYIRQMHKNSAYAFEQVLTAIQNLHSGLRESLDVLKSQLELKYGSMDAALIVLKNPAVSELDVAELLGYLNTAIANAAIKHAEMVRADGVISGMLPNTDGFAIYAKQAVASGNLQKRFEDLSAEGLILRAGDASPEHNQAVVEFLAKFEKYSEDAAFHARSQKELMEVSAYLSPLSDFSALAKDSLYGEVVNIVRKLGVGQPVVPTKALYTLEEIDSVLARFLDTGSRDMATLSPVVEALRTHLMERFPGMARKIEEILEDVKLQAKRPAQRVPTDVEIESLRVSASKASQRLNAARIRLDKVAEVFDNINLLKSDVVYFEKEIKELKARLVFERKAYNRVRFGKLGLSFGEVGSRGMLENLADSRQSLTWVEDNLKELYSSLRQAKSDLDLAQGSSFMGKNSVQDDYDAALYTYNTSLSSATKRQQQYEAALDIFTLGSNQSFDYRESLLKLRVLVAQQKTSIEVAHLREVFAYYGVDLGDSITQDIFNKNVSFISRGKDFGKYFDDSVRVEMEIINLQKISDDLEIRLRESLLVRPAVKSVASRATKVVDSEAAVSKAQNDLDDLLQSPEYMFAKSAKNRTNTLIILSQLDGSKVDWTLGGRVNGPVLQRAQQMGGDFSLQEQFINPKFWAALFVKHEDMGPYATALADWAHSGRVLAITNPEVLAREGADNISYERSLHYLIDYLKKLDSGEGKMIVGNELQALRTKPINRWWDSSGHSKQFKRERELNAIVVAKPIKDASPVKIADAQKVIVSNINVLKAEQANLLGEVRQATVDAVYSPVLLDDAFSNLSISNKWAKDNNAEEVVLSILSEDSNFGSQVDAAINDVINSGPQGPVEYSSLRERELGLGYPIGYETTMPTPSSEVSFQFEVELANAKRFANQVDDVVVHTPFEQKSREQLLHEIETLTDMRRMGIETTEIKSGGIRQMIRVREDALGIKRKFLSLNGLPVSIKLRMKPKKSNGLDVIDPNTKQVIMEPDVRASNVGTYRRYDDGTKSGVLYLRKEDMSLMKLSARNARAQQLGSTDKWVEVRWRPITPDDMRATFVRGDEAATNANREALGYFVVYENPGSQNSASRWLKTVEYGDEQWARSSSEYGFSSEQANTFGAVIEVADSPDLLGAVPTLRESLTIAAPPRPMTASEEAISRLQSDLESISSTVDASNKKSRKVARSANTKAQNLVTDLQAQFDSVKGLVQPHDPVAIKKLEDRIREVQDMINSTQRGVAFNPRVLVNKTSRVKSKIDGRYYNESRPVVSGRTIVRTRVAGTSSAARSYNQGIKTLDEGIEMLRTFGTRGPGFSYLENIAQRQIQLQAEYDAAVAVLGNTEIEQRLLAGLQNSIYTLEKSGRLSDAVGQEVGRFASSNVRKFFPDLEEGWRYLSRGIYNADGVKGDYGIYPGLAGSLEFVALWRRAKRFDDPAYLRELQRYVGSYTKFFKAYATMTPGFHVRNGLANAVKLAFMGAEFSNMMEATPLYIDWMKASRVGIQYEDWVLSKPVELRAVLRTARKSMFGSGGGIFTVDFKDAVGGSRLWDNKLVRFNAKWGQESDNYSRFVLGFDSAKSGMDVGMAQARTKRAFYDYEDLSEVDAVMRQIVPFWLWTSRNLIFELQNQWLNPKPYQIYRSIMRNMRDPDYETSEYPSPFVREIGGIKLPFGDNLYFAPDLGFTRTPQQLGELFDPIRYTNNLNPLLKIPLEEFLGRSVFTGNPLDNPQERLIHILKGFVPPVQMGDRLIGSEGDAAKNAWLSFVGSPVRTYQTKEK